MRATILAASFCVLALAGSLRAQEQVVLLPPLPPEEVLAAFNPGPGRAETAASCGLCHAPAIITGKHYSADKWAAVVDHMVDRGAKVSDADYDTIVDYLARHYGPVTAAVSVQAGSASGSGAASVPAHR